MFLSEPSIVMMALSGQSVVVISLSRMLVLYLPTLVTMSLLSIVNSGEKESFTTPLSFPSLSITTPEWS